MDHLSQDLRDQFLARLDGPATDPENGWMAIWRLIVSHPWYQLELESAATRLLRRAGLSDDWLDEIKNEAMLRLAQELSRHRDLHVDRARAQEHFSGWLSTIIEHDCEQALRHVSDAEHPTVSLRPDDNAIELISNVESEIDLSMAIKKLPPPIRTIVALSREGWSLKEIAAQLGISYWKACREYNRGIALLRKMI